MSFEIKPSTRQGIIPLFCLWGGTGSGKTRSSIMLARGMAGPTGRVTIIDTEAKRSGYYSDSIPGGYNRLDFDPPFTPERYVEALDVAEGASDVVVIDSASHAWFGPDGVLDLHEQALDKMTKGSNDWQQRERLNWPAWREPKMRFKHLTAKLLGFKTPLIVCFRGELKSKMAKNDKGYNVVVTDTTTSPVFDSRFIFESHIAIECFQKDGRGGYIRFPMPYAKTSHQDMRALLPNDDEQLTIEHGAALVKWCSSPSCSKPAAPVDPLKAEMAKLWNLCKPFRGEAKTWALAEDQLRKWGDLPADKTIKDLTPAELADVIEKTNIRTTETNS
jgi:hypothetical protein